MKTAAIFADQLRFWPMRFLSENSVRNYLVKKSGSESGAFHYKHDLSEADKRFIILPNDLVQVSVYLPLLLQLARAASKESLHLLADISFQPLLKAVGLESIGLFVDFAKLRFGDDYFHAQEQRIRKLNAVVCVMLEPKPSLLQLYLARTSGATWRLGAACEEHYPFLNISFHPETTSAYGFRRHLQDIFKVEGSVQDHPFAHNPEKLSSRHVILLNMEASASGATWRSEELTEIARLLDPHFRLLALSPKPNLIEPFASLLERLSIRTAPIASSYTAFLDLLRQYHGMISLNSAHAQLAINISHIPTLLFSDPSDVAWIPSSYPELHLVERGKPLSKDVFASLIDKTNP